MKQTDVLIYVTFFYVLDISKKNSSPNNFRVYGNVFLFYNSVEDVFTVEVARDNLLSK